MDALSQALSVVEPRVLKDQLTRYVPADAQRILAAAGIRDEHVFPTPILLEAKPTLIGYYRLLLGVPQKGFYNSSDGLSSQRHERILKLVNASGRNVVLALASDPDVRIQEEFSGALRN